MKRFLKVASALAYVALHNYAILKAAAEWSEEGCIDTVIIILAMIISCVFLMNWSLFEFVLNYKED